MKRIPNYALYGETALPPWQDLLHFEWINQRSQVHQWEIKPHQHDSLLQLVYLRSGHGTVSLENSHMSFSAPSLVLLPRRTVHAFSFSPDTDGTVITAAQRPLESMARILSSELLGLLQRPSVFPLPWLADGQEPIWPLIELIRQEATHQARGHVAAGLSLLLALLMQIARLNPPTLPAPPKKGNQTVLLNQFRELVDKQFSNHWPLGFYAETLGISTAKLARICRDEAGESPMALVNQRIMREAQRLLAYAELDIQQIARTLGFRDSAYFSRYFRKQAGIRPSEFRAAFRHPVTDEIEKSE